jgi:hypothetical protein
VSAVEDEWIDVGLTRLEKRTKPRSHLAFHLATLEPPSRGAVVD